MLLKEFSSVGNDVEFMRKWRWAFAISQRLNALTSYFKVLLEVSVQALEIDIAQT